MSRPKSRRLLCRTALALLAVVCFSEMWSLPTAASLSHAQAVTPVRTVMTSTWQWGGHAGSVMPTVEIVGVRGHIIVEGASTRDIQISATRRSETSDPKTVDIIVTRPSGGLKVVTKYPDPPPGPPDECPVYDEERGDFWHYNVKVDFRVSIPKGSAIKIRTYVGNIEVAALRGAVDVSTNDGSVTLRGLDGPVRASAIGDITCQLSGAANGGNVALSVYGGTAHLIVPSGERLNTSTGVRATARPDALELIRASGAASERLTGVLERTKRQVTVEVSRGVALLHAR